MQTQIALVVVALATMFGLGIFDPAFAGPGGIVKAVATSFWGQVGICLLLIIFSPLVIWYYTKRHKHVKRVQNDMARLATIYPQYRWLNVKDRATEIFTWVWSAWGDEKMSLASNMTTHWYWQNQQMLLDRWEKEGLKNVCRLFDIKKITPIFIDHIDNDGGAGSRIVLEINASVRDYLENRETGEVVSGDKNIADLETIWTLMWQDNQWRLNLIEDIGQELNYMGMPSQLPAQFQTPQTSRKEVQL